MAELEGVYVSGVPHYGPKGMRAWIIVVVTWMMTLACVSIILRVLSRRVRKQKLWWDDYLVMFSMVSKHGPPPESRIAFCVTNR